MRINTNTDSIELTVTEQRTIEKARKIFVNLGKHGTTPSLQEDAAKVVAGMNRIQIELERSDVELEV